jgi:hypothetical protein
LDWDETTKRWRHKLQGLEHGSTAATTHISMVSSSTRKPPAVPTVANVNVPNVPNRPTSMVSVSMREPLATPTLPSVNMPDVPNVPDVPKKRKRKGKSGGVRYRMRDTSLQGVEAALAVIEWDEKGDEKADEIDGKLHNMDGEIRKEFANLFEEPVGLPPHRLGIGDF